MYVGCASVNPPKPREAITVTISHLVAKPSPPFVFTSCHTTNASTIYMYHHHFSGVRVGRIGRDLGIGIGLFPTPGPDLTNPVQ